MTHESTAVLRETYVPGHEKWIERHLSHRSGDQYAAFLKPYLRPGLRVLDCGCGPGAITLDLASQVEPGEVVGIDIEIKSVEAARATAADRGVSNVSFERGDVYALPFPDASFDVVYANTLMIHLGEPLLALGEMHRVLKPGGIAAMSDLDMGAWAHAPEEPAIRMFQEIATRLLEKSGANPYYAPSLRNLLIEAGFADVEGGGFTAAYGTPERIRALLPMVDRMTRVPGGPELVQDAAERLGVTPVELIDRMRAWLGRPDAFFMRVFCTGLGWKPTRQ